MTRAIEAIAFYPGTSQVPPILIEDGVEVGVQHVIDFYDQANEALDRFFGQPLTRDSVSEIYLSSDTGSQRGKNDIGAFGSNNEVILYPNRIHKSERTWQEVFGHELGHAYHEQSYLTNSIQKLPHIGCEAIAEMIVPIIAKRGNINHIFRHLVNWMHSSNRLLFGPVTALSGYPRFWEKKQDSVQMFYVVNQFGFDVAVDLAGKTALGLVTEFGNTKADIFFPDSCHFRAQLLNWGFMNRLGITRDQLFYDARKWYSHSL